MAQPYLLVERYHVTMRTPDDMTDAAAEEVRAVLVSKPFVAKVRAAVAAVVAEHTPLIVVRVLVTR